MTLQEYENVGAVSAWLTGCELQTYKVVIVGEPATGKSCLVKTQLQSSSTDASETNSVYKPTVIAKVHSHTLPGLCHFYIVDISGKTDLSSAAITDQYLHHLDCLVFVFALDEPETLEKLQYWHDAIEKVFKGDLKSLHKVVVGTKMDLIRHMGIKGSVNLQEKASSFACSIDAVFCVTNVQDTFLTIGQALVRRPPALGLKAKKAYEDTIHADDKVVIVNDELRPAAFEVLFPDPILVQHGEGRVVHISMSNVEQGLVLKAEKESSEEEQFLWKIPTEKSCPTHEPELVPIPQKLDDSRGLCNALWKCLMSTDPVSVWQFEGLDSVVPVTSTVRRQPTYSHLRGIKHFLFCSSVNDREGGLYYMLLLTEQNKLMECGLTPTFFKQGRNFSEMALQMKREFSINPKPVYLSGNINVDSFSLSPSHAAVALSNGHALAWGDGKSGALGIEEHQKHVQHTFPMEMCRELLHSKVTQVACGLDFTLILTQEGEVYSCGSGAFGKLGHGDQENKFLPTKVENLVEVKAISAGHHHAIALTSRWVIYSWGLQCPVDGTDEFSHQLTPKKLECNDDLRVEQIATGAYHSLCVGHGLVRILFDGAAYTWGSGVNGQLGWGTYKSLRIPCRVGELYYKEKVKVTAVSGGLKHSAFLTSDGDIYTCGNNQYGQLGYLTDREDIFVPRKVELGTNSSGDRIRATAVSCSGDCTMVEDDILIWGQCSYGPVLPDPHGINAEETPLMDVATVYVPCNNSMLELSLALTADGKLMLCSVNQSGCDHSTIVACHKKLIPCSNPTKCFVHMTAAANILVTVDKEGTARYATVDSWIRSFMGISGELPTDMVQTLAIIFNKKNADEIPKMDFKDLNIPDAVSQVEATVKFFLLRTDVGDAFCWAPFTGEPPARCDELDNRIVVQIACGSQHFAALCDDSLLFTRGHGTYGQLGFGTFDHRSQFEMVPLCQYVKIESLFCGWGSTCVLTTEGKVFFWGQLDVPKEEKLQMRCHIFKNPEFGTVKINGTMENKPPIPTRGLFNYELKFDHPDQDMQIAVTGRAFNFQIVPRRERDACVNDMIFRVEAWFKARGEKLHVKGKSCNQGNGCYSGTITFLKEGHYDMSVSTASGATYCIIQVQKGCPVRTCKLSLVGDNTDAVNGIEETLKQELIPVQGSRTSLKFPGRDLAIELWGHPMLLTDPDGSVGKVVSLSSITDEEVVVYIWDEHLSAQFPEDSFNIWLHYMACHAPNADIVLLRITSNAKREDEYVLTPFRNVNPNFKRVLTVKDDYENSPGSLINQLREIVESKLMNLDPSKKIISETFEAVAERLRRLQGNNICILSHVQFKHLANECGIQGQGQYRDALRYLQRVGVCLVPQTEDVCVITRYHWYAHQLAELVLHSDGTIDAKTLDPVKKVLVGLLVEKGVAFTIPRSTKVCVLPRLQMTEEELWSQSEDGVLCVFRHLHTKKCPYEMFTSFPTVSSEIAKIYENVTIRKYAVIIHGDGFKGRVDLGPCLIDRTIAEVRVVVQTKSSDIAGKAVDEVVKILQDKEHGSVETSEILISCQKCFKSSIPFDLAEEAAKTSEQETVACPRCYHPSIATQLMNGYTETRQLPDLLTSVVSGKENVGSPWRDINKHIDRSMKSLEQKVLSESQTLFGNLVKFFMDMEKYDTPRLVVLAPCFEDAPHKLKGNVIRNLKQTLLTWKKQKFRLHLLCEGNGDGTGIHFLESHKGYELAEVNEFIIKFINGLGFGIQILISWLPIAQTIHNYAKQSNIGGLDGLFPSIEAVANWLGFTGITKATLDHIKWKDYFKEMQKFLEGFQKEIKQLQDAAGAIPQPKQLGDKLQSSIGYRLDGKEYEYLRDLLKRLDPKKSFGGLVKETREGLGLVWVCERHSRQGETERVHIDSS